MQSGVEREIPVAHAPAPLSASEVARLEALRRVAMGAAHALNNAFTAVVGEASFLREERKGDPGVVEPCDAILAELDRCAKLTRALLARRHPSQAGAKGVDLVRVVRELGALLGETLGRQHALELSYPDDVVVARGEAGALELLVLLLVHHGADQARGPARLLLSAAPAAGGRAARLELRVESASLAHDAAERCLDPERLADALARNQLQALHAVASSLRGHLAAAREAAGTLRVWLDLPADS